MTKSMYKQKCFFVITKNWEILTKNLLFSKYKMGLRMENINMFGVHRRISFLEGGL